MKKTILIFGLLLLISLLVILFYSRYFQDDNTQPIDIPVVTPSAIYDNPEYGLKVSLPDSWKGYSVVSSVWNGNPLLPDSSSQIGPKLLFRHPLWTDTLHYQDIPILVFTLRQWESYQAEDFAVSAAPISATEVARNNRYVFALPPRWDFDYSKGYEEAQAIVRTNPFSTYTVSDSEYTKLTFIATVGYLCDKGKTITTSYYKDGAVGKVRVSLDGGEPLTLKQTIAASGIRYGTDDESFVFWSKGDSALIMRENSMDMTYTNCSAAQ